jgi:adenylylsulfate kinase-like enzyme
VPESPELTVDTMTLSVEKSVQRVLDYVERNFTLSAS